MSSKSRRRSPHRPSIRVASTSGAERRPGRSALDALEIARDLPQVTSPVEAEILVSGAVGMSGLPTDEQAAERTGTDAESADALFDAARDASAWSALIDAAAGTESRRGLALLRGMAVLLPAPQAGQAAREADRLAARLPEPAWADALSRLVPDQCWMGDAAQAAGYSMVIATYTYAGAERHGLVLSIDQTLDGAAKDVFLTTEPESAREQMADLYDTFGPVDPAEAHRTIADAYYKSAAMDAPLDPDIPRLRILVDHRIRRFSATP